MRNARDSRKMLQTYKRTVAAWLLILLASCSGPSGPTRADVAGTYTLRTVNGAPLPFTDDLEFVRILSSELHLTESALSAFLLLSTEPPDQSSSPSEFLYEVGWGLSTGDSLEVNVIYPNFLDDYPGQVRGDTVRLRSADAALLPDGLYAFVREGE